MLGVPLGRDRLDLRVERHARLAVEVDVAADARPGPGEAEKRKRDRDRDVDTDLADVDLVSELARRGAGLGEDGRAVAAFVLVDQFDGLVVLFFLGCRRARR